ncbi:MAG: HIT domain-containing protein [bacterium]|nr:HIT domain-containing protein [bacterium]MDZ4299388.1 HIT domain-containing protein [Candidatus Sungbacteria bacterium]
MDGCLFCGIAGGAVKTEMVFADDAVCVFRDIHPKAPVHFLIIPREHIESIAHLEEHHAAIVAQLIFTAKRVAAEQGLEGYKLVFNVGRDGGQVIDHLHLHLLGGWKDGEKISG